MILVVVLFTASLLFAAGVREESVQVIPEVETVATYQEPVDVQLDDPSGKEVATYGTYGVLEGSLHNVKDEWYLACDGKMYEMHMGIYGHNEPDMFLEGAPAIVSGFIYQQHIAPVQVETPQTTRQFWSEDRFPKWAGGGDGRNQVAYPGERGVASPIYIGR